VSQFLLLDSGPLGLLTHPQRTADVIAITGWVSLKRELPGARKSAGIARLDAFVDATPGRYLPLTDEALRLAAELWAHSRQAGRPTAEASALDIDVLIAAQALSFGTGSGVVVVTTNPRHLSQYVAARLWSEIPS
jgi:predicted nucleic acid-binding protein